MRKRYFFLTFLVLFSRGCDFYSTSLWFFGPGGSQGEMNPLTRYLGFGWNGLLASNAIIILVILGLLYYFFFYYKPKKILPGQPANFREFASLLYFNEKGKFWQIMYKLPKNKEAFMAHLGFTLTITVIVGSLLATIHNLCQFYQVQAYDAFRDFVGRPLYVIYGLILITLISTILLLLHSEFRLYKSNYGSR